MANTGATQIAPMRLRPAREKPSALFTLDMQTGQHHDWPVWLEFSSDEGGGSSVDLTLAAGEVRVLQGRAVEVAPPHLERATITVESYDGKIARGYATQNGAGRVLAQHGERTRFVESPEAIKVPSPLLLPDDWEARRDGPNLLPLMRWTPSKPREGARSTHCATFSVASPLALWAHVAEVEAMLFLNGEPAQDGAPAFDIPPWLPDGAWFRIALRTGENTLECALDAHSVAPPVVLLGEFAFDEEGNLIAPEEMLLGEGSWHEQGLPFYAGAVDYAQPIAIPAHWSNCRVWLELSRVREAVEVWLNDAPCGTRFVRPWRFEVTEQLRPGVPNRLRLRVWNTSLPARGIDELPPAGLLGPLRLVAYPIVEIET
jgi:hypothetical protein